MSPIREAFVLPGIFLTVTLLGGLRISAHVQLLPPTVMALVLGMLLLGCLVRSSVLIPERLMNAGRSALENISGSVVMLTLLAASAQIFNLVTPEVGLLHTLFSVFLLVQLLTTLAAVRDRISLLRGLFVLLGSVFLLRFIVLEALYAPGTGTLKRVLTALLEGVTLGTLQYEPNAPSTGYFALLALALYMIGLVLLSHAGSVPTSGVPGSMLSESRSRPHLGPNHRSMRAAQRTFAIGRSAPRGLTSVGRAPIDGTRPWRSRAPHKSLTLVDHLPV